MYKKKSESKNAQRKWEKMTDERMKNVKKENEIEDMKPKIV